MSYWFWAFPYWLKKKFTFLSDVCSSPTHRFYKLQTSHASENLICSHAGTAWLNHISFLLKIKLFLDLRPAGNVHISMLICVLWVLKSYFIVVLQGSTKALGGVGHIIFMNFIFSWRGFTQLSSVGTDRTSNFRITEWWRLSGTAGGHLSQHLWSLELVAQDHVHMAFEYPQGWAMG